MHLSSGAFSTKIPAYEASSNDCGQRPPPRMHDVNPAFMCPPAFSEACLSLVDRSRDVDSDGRMGWRVLGVFGKEIDQFSTQADNQYLAIARSLQNDGSSTVKCLFADDESRLDGVSEAYEEEDDIAIHHPKAISPSVEYNILLSPTYRVPVLYFFLHNLPSSHMSNLDAIHHLLVPEHTKPELKQVGIIGGISMTNHPVTDVPVYFIHPCNTAEAMQDIVGARTLSPQEYLQIWIGLVGSCVGLYLPSQLVVNIRQDE